MLGLQNLKPNFVLLYIKKKYNCIKIPQDKDFNALLSNIKD